MAKKSDSKPVTIILKGKGAAGHTAPVTLTPASVAEFTIERVSARGAASKPRTPLGMYGYQGKEYIVWNEGSDEIPAYRAGLLDSNNEVSQESIRRLACRLNDAGVPTAELVEPTERTPKGMGKAARAAVQELDTIMGSEDWTRESVLLKFAEEEKKAKSKRGPALDAILAGITDENTRKIVTDAWNKANKK